MAAVGAVNAMMGGQRREIRVYREPCWLFETL